MRGLVVQFLLPVLILLLGVIVGAIAGSVVWGVILGGLSAILAAIALARHARLRLEWLELVSRQDSRIDLEFEATRDDWDQIEHAIRSVAQQGIRLNRQRDVMLRTFMQHTQVLDQMYDGLMRVGQDGTVTYANVAASTLFGGRNPTGRTMMSVTHDHELNTAVRTCLETGVEQHHTVEIPGENRLISAVAIRLGDEELEVLVMLRDITELARLQNLRRDFVANVSHELRTPLSTIKILTETLLDIGERDEQSMGFLHKIEGEVDSMTALVRDLLDLTRLETTGSRLTLREIDAATLIQDVSDRMRPLAERSDIELNVEAERDAGWLVGDEQRLHQALINLMTNAILHTAGGGSVSVVAGRVERGTQFTVRDTGRGIPAEDLPRIWERFFKADRARSGPGTGIGLAIVKHIVQAHEGSVGASSALGSGSSFWFVIPDNLGPVPKLPPAYEVPVAPN